MQMKPDCHVIYTVQCIFPYLSIQTVLIWNNLFTTDRKQHEQIQSCVGSRPEPLFSTELFLIAAVVVCIVGGPRLTKGQDNSEPPALATWGNVGKRARE